MAKQIFIIGLLCFINTSIISSYNINTRIFNNIDYEPSEEILNKTRVSSSSSLSIDRCIPVRAVRELGCLLSAKNILFQGLFRSACERHQLCYACGFAHSITARQCNQWALLNMYELCSKNTSISSSDCLKQRYSALSLLRQEIYRSVSYSLGFFFECQQECVFDYLQPKQNSTDMSMFYSKIK